MSILTGATGALVCLGLSLFARDPIPLRANLKGDQSIQVFQLTVQSEVVPLNDLLIKAQEFDVDLPASQSEVLVRLGPSGLLDLWKDEDGKSWVKVVNQTGADLNRSVPLRLDLLKIRDLSAHYGYLGSFDKNISGFLPSIGSYDLRIETRRLFYSDYAVSRADAFVEGGGVDLNESKLEDWDYSTRAHHFGWAYVRTENGSHRFPVVGVEFGGKLQLRTPFNWRASDERASLFQKIFEWDRKFWNESDATKRQNEWVELNSKWRQMKRSAENSNEEITAVKAEMDQIESQILEMRRADGRRQLVQELVGSVEASDSRLKPNADAHALQLTENLDGLELHWTFRWEDSLGPEELAYELHSWNNAQEADSSRLYYVSWLEAEGENPDGTKPIVGVWSEYFKERGNRSFICPSLDPGELHYEMAGLKMPDGRIVFFDYALWEGELDVVRLFELSPIKSGGYKLKISLWLKGMLDESIQASFRHFNKEIFTPTDFTSP